MEVFYNVDAKQDYDTFINKFEELHNESIPPKTKGKGKTDHNIPG